LISQDLRDDLVVKSLHNFMVNIHTCTVRAYVKKN